MILSPPRGPNRAQPCGIPSRHCEMAFFDAESLQLKIQEENGENMDSDLK